MTVGYGYNARGYLEKLEHGATDLVEVTAQTADDGTTATVTKVSGRTTRGRTVGADVRYPDPGPGFDDVFLFEDRRRVMKDRTVSLDGRLYEVDAVLVGRTVVLRHDPAAPPGRPLQVVLDGKPAGEATVLDAYANTAVRRVRPSSHIETDDPAPEPPPSRIAMRDLGEENA